VFHETDGKVFCVIGPNPWVQAEHVILG
jgi:hypothetical protein